MGVTVSVANAKAGFAELVTRAERGEEIIVTRNGRPVARIAPLDRQEQILFGDLAGLHIADDLSLPAEVTAAFEAAKLP